MAVVCGLCKYWSHHVLLLLLQGLQVVDDVAVHTRLEDGGVYYCYLVDVANGVDMHTEAVHSTGHNRDHHPCNVLGREEDDDEMMDAEDDGYHHHNDHTEDT